METIALENQVITPPFKLWLQQQFTSRCKRNPRYSLRSFARLLEMDPSSVSQILSGKRQVSTKVIQKICENLSVTPKLKKDFLNQTKEKFKKISNEQLNSSPNYELMTEDAFAIISEWHHFALLELIQIDGFDPSPSWCSKALGITTLEAHMALDRMLRLGLLRSENNKIVRTNKSLTNFTEGMTSSAHKNLQRQILKMALDAIDQTDSSEKDITGMTMAIDTKKLPEAKKLIAKFRRDLCQYLENGDQNQVYQLGIQLYPISKKIN